MPNFLFDVSLEGREWNKTLNRLLASTPNISAIPGFNFSYPQKLSEFHKRKKVAKKENV